MVWLSSMSTTSFAFMSSSGGQEGANYCTLQHTHNIHVRTSTHIYIRVKCVLYVCLAVCWDTRHVHRTNTLIRTHTTAQMRALHAAPTPTPTSSPRLFIGRTRTATFTLVPLMAAKRQTKSDGSEHQLINIANKSKSIEFYAHIRHTPAWPEQAEISASPLRGGHFGMIFEMRSRASIYSRAEVMQWPLNGGSFSHSWIRLHSSTLLSLTCGSCWATRHRPGLLKNGNSFCCSQFLSLSLNYGWRRRNLADS